MTTPRSAHVPQLDPAEGARLVADGAYLLDVREVNEWVAGHAAEADHVALAAIPDRARELPADRTIVIICRSGVRSQRAAEYLRIRGLDAVNLAGGMRAWADRGLDVVTDDGGPGTVI